MKVSRKTRPDGKIELHITAPPTKVDEAIRFVNFQLAYENELDPLIVADVQAALIALVGESYYNSARDFHVMEFLAPFAVTQEKLDIVMRPQIEAGAATVQPGQALSFTAVVTPKPTFEVSSYEPVQIKVPRNTSSQREQANIIAFLAASEFAGRFQGQIPDELFEFTREEILANYARSLKAQDMDLETFIEQQPGGSQQFSMALMMQVREVLTHSFCLDALARHLKLEVDEADIEEVFSQMIAGRERETRQEYELTGRMYLIREAALRGKANKWLAQTAVIEYVDVDTAAGAGADAGAEAGAGAGAEADAGADAEAGGSAGADAGADAS
ncbi:MAG: hypothetical protein LBR39_08090 [Coriobacteriales bacterium]|jgi:FKBP-type peptidyl-prolyl cis-trans isomerase (trigger factor)|nr:hypothetical protein [Coriobacteriales bacterium]